MPIAGKRNNVLFIGIDKVALAAMLEVTPSYVRQILRGKRRNPVQLGKMESIIEAELRWLRSNLPDGKELLRKLISDGKLKTCKEGGMRTERNTRH